MFVYIYNIKQSDSKRICVHITGISVSLPYLFLQIYSMVGGTSPILRRWLTSPVTSTREASERGVFRRAYRNTLNSAPRPALKDFIRVSSEQ